MYEIYWILNSLLWFGFGWFCAKHYYKPKKNVFKFCECEESSVDIMTSEFCTECGLNLK